MVEIGTWARQGFFGGCSVEKGSGYVKAFWGAVLVSFGVWGLADSPVSNTLGLEDYHHGALILLTFKEEGNRCMRRQARPGERVYNGVYIYTLPI